MWKSGLKITIFLVLLFLPFVEFAQGIKKDSLDINLLEKLITQKIDSLRTTKKLNPFLFNDTVYKAAKFHADYMVKSGTLSHYQTKAETKTVANRIQKFGLKKSYYGENIAYVFCDFSSKMSLTDYKIIADNFVKMWVKSKPHYENITDPQYIIAAVALSYNYSTNKLYAAHNFTSMK